MCWFIMDECHIGNIAVHPEYRNQGIATKLLNELLRDCKKEHGTVNLLLEVRVSNEPAINLYTKLGYDVVKQDIYNDVVMRACEKDLRKPIKRKKEKLEENIIKK